MLIDHLLFPIGFQYDNKIIKSTDDSAHLKTVCQENRYRLSLLAHHAQHPVLQIDFVSHYDSSNNLHFLVSLYTEFLQIICRIL